MRLDHLDGGGRILAPVFVAALAGRRFGKCFEWCGGPSWIGFALLENGICDELVTADINPEATEAAQAEANAKGYRATVYTSNNMRDIPKNERFDLVVSNPPNYCDIQPSHLLGYLRHDLRPSDIGWKIHREFYATIGPHLSEDAELWINEVEPYETEVVIGGAVYDKRPEPPIDTFRAMLDDAGMLISDVIEYDACGLHMGLLKIERRRE